MRRFTCLLLACFLTSTSASYGADPLHQRIDALLQRDAVGPIAPACSDETFVRRVYLDLTGMIPTTQEARTFLQDDAPDKRGKLVDALLSGTRFTRRLTGLLDIMFMERRADKNIKRDEWNTYLLQSVQANKPYNVLCREILGSDGADDKTRAAAKFFLDRGSEANLMTRDVGRVFFGVDLQCAQCHNHPLVEDYYQRDYYGLYEFVSRSYVFDDKKAKKKFLAERPEGDIDFKSVFTEQAGYTQPKLPGAAAITEPVVKLGQEYKVKPAKDVRPVPAYSRRARLAELATNGSNDAFNRNIANRLWATVMGRGIVEPVDLHHTSNPPSHPELLDLLSREFVAMNFDMKAYLRELVLTDAYARRMTLPENLAARQEFAKNLVTSLQSELEAKEKVAQDADVAYTESLEAVGEASVSVLPLRSERDKARKSWAAAKTKFAATSKPLKDATAKRDAAMRIVNAIKPAFDAAAEAAKSLPEDKSLGEVVAAFKAKHDPQAATLATAEKAVVAQQAASKVASDAMVAAAKQMDETLAKINAANSATSEKEKTQIEAETKRRALVLSVKQMQQRLEWAKGYLLVLDSEQAVSALDAGLATATQETARLAQAVETLHTEMNRSAETMAAEAAKLKAAEETLVALKKSVEESNNAADAVAALQKHETQMLAVAKSKTAAEAAFTKAKSDLATAVATQVKLKAEQTSLDADLSAARQKLDAASTELTVAGAEQFAIAELKPLTPEQFGWSMMQIGGLVERQVTASTAALDKAEPLDEAGKKDPKKLAERARKAESAALTKLQANVNSFVKLYGGGPGQPQNEFFATVDQALFFSNSGSILGWLRPSGVNLTGRLGKIEDVGQLADEMYMGVLTRSPTDIEKQEVTAYIKGRDADRAAAIQEMVWALASSVEFRFNH